MRAATFVSQPFFAIPAYIGIIGMVQVTPQGKIDIGQQQGIAYVVQRKDTEYHIIDGADGKEP